MSPSPRKRAMLPRRVRPQPRRESEEFGPGKAGFLLCPDCKAVYDKKRWVADFAGVRDINERKRVAFRRCPACQMIRDRKFEGQVIAQGVPARRVEEVLARIRNVGDLARRRDPLDRIIAVRRRGQRIELTTTENQLAVRIGREIRDLVKGKLDIRWSHEEDVVRVFWGPA